MSSKAISAATTHFLQFRIQYASLALLYWDYMLTLRNELQYIWTKSSLSKPSTLLYILCRYALLANLLYLLAIAGKLGDDCNTWYKFVGAISVLGRAAVLATFTMRTYAVWSQNKYILVLLGSIAFTCVVLDCLHVPGLRCTGSSSIQIANTLLSILVCVFEFLSTALTLLRCFQSLKAGGPYKLQQGTFFYLVAQQGILYFGIVFMFTTAAAILNFRAPNGFFQRLLNGLTLPLSGLLTARFLLHLRAWNESPTVYSRSRPGFRDGEATQEVSAFQAIANAVVSEFGEDPVVAAQNGTTRSATDNTGSSDHDYQDVDVDVERIHSFSGRDRKEKYRERRKDTKTRSVSGGSEDDDGSDHREQHEPGGLRSHMWQDDQSSSGGAPAVVDLEMGTVAPVEVAMGYKSPVNREGGAFASSSR